MARYTLTISGRLDNLNDYISACRTNQYKGSKVKASNEHKVLAAIYARFFTDSIESLGEPMFEYRHFTVRESDGKVFA